MHLLIFYWKSLHLKITPLDCNLKKSKFYMDSIFQYIYIKRKIHKCNNENQEWGTSKKKKKKTLLVGYNLHNPLQAGTSAIPSKHTALLPIPTCAERDQTAPEAVLGCELPPSVLHGFAQRTVLKAECKPAKLTGVQQGYRAAWRPQECSQESSDSRCI